MKTDLFHFDLPPERIAAYPVSPRDSARLLVVKSASMQDHTIRELPDLLQPGDLLVFNDTKVIAARLEGRRGEAKIAITLLHYKGDGSWQVYAKPSKRLKIGDIITFNNRFPAKVMHKDQDGTLMLTWHLNEWKECIELYGRMPIPPYMKRKSGDLDNISYQTVYAQNEGAVAAPTAGLHFTQDLLAGLQERNIGMCHITLHIGAGTFQPVKTENTDQHRMHEEYYEISNYVADKVNQALEDKRRVVAIGTTSLRALESSVNAQGRLRPGKRQTNIFITPGYSFKVADILLTNFHLSRSTLIMLVSAFSGMDTIRRAYQHAIEEKYRFYSYGDACLLYKD